MTELEEYQKARDRVQEVKGFYAHVAMFLVANVALAILNFATLEKNDGVIWFIWPLIGWGVVLVVHAISVFGIGRFLGRDWEQRHIQQELDRRHKNPGRKERRCPWKTLLELTYRRSAFLRTDHRG